MKSVIICDMEGVIQEMNKGALDMFGYSKDELSWNKKGFYFFRSRHSYSKCFGLVR